MQLDFGIQANEIGIYEMPSSFIPTPENDVQRVRFKAQYLVLSPIEHPSPQTLDAVGSDFECNFNPFTSKADLEVTIVQEISSAVSINLDGQVIGYIPEVVVECARMFNSKVPSKMLLKYNFNTWSVVLP